MGFERTIHLPSVVVSGASVEKVYAENMKANCVRVDAIVVCVIMKLFFIKVMFTHLYHKYSLRVKLTILDSNDRYFLFIATVNIHE